MTILSTPASRPALMTRRAPSRAGTMSSSGSLGCSAGNGEATCSTPPQPATASAQPASAPRSAATTVRRSPASTPARSTVARTAGSRATSRTVVRTSWPRRSSSATHQPPRKPVPPVTRTVAFASLTTCAPSPMARVRATRGATRGEEPVDGESPWRFPDRGGPQMTRKADFNAEEWSTVAEGPLYAGLRVISADRGGTLRESVALSRVYKEAHEHSGGSELLDELVKAPPSIAPDQVREAAANPAVASERLRAAMGILEAKATPEEIDTYKKFVMTAAQAAASAHKEGGFLGIGGRRSATPRTGR